MSGPVAPESPDAARNSPCPAPGTDEYRSFLRPRPQDLENGDSALYHAGNLELTGTSKMDIAELHPELRKSYSRMPTLPLHVPGFYPFISLLMKLIPNKAKPVPGVSVQDVPVKHCNVRVYRPEGGNCGAGLMWIHGGGYIIGNTAMNDRECVALARDLGLVVASVDYRLAPKHPFPAALDDCMDAWQFMSSCAGQWGIDRSRMAVLGQSAGGGLAASLAQRIADAGGVQPAAQVLWYPMLDDRTAANGELDTLRHRFWNNRNNRVAWEYYLGQAAGATRVPPYAVPARRDDLSGLPPTWIGVGELDLFYAEDRAYAEQLTAAGVDCELYLAPRAPHAFDALVPDSSVARETVQDYYRFLRSHLQI